ncbi:hypothetical protein D3C72_1788170 [compost metagenome]
MRDEFFFHGRFIQGRFQQQRRGRVLRDFQVQSVEQHAVELAHFQLAEIFLQGQFHLHGRAETVRQILLEQGQQRFGAVQFGLVERVQVQLERFRLDDVRRIGRRADLGDGHLRLAALVQPRQFIRIPDIEAEERQCAMQLQLVALALARNRKQQFRRVIGAVGGAFAQGRLFGEIVGGGHGRVA